MTAPKDGASPLLRYSVRSVPNLNVRHHIEQEETQMLPGARELGKDMLMQLGEKMAARTKDLMAAYSRGEDPMKEMAKAGPR